MLYKKYHRNFVKQFKMGTRYGFKAYSGEIYKDIVRKEPFYNRGINMTGKKFGWTLVFPGGRIERSIKIIEENAV